ncbi:DUF6703 family protein [Spongiactinospora gelatinilytica]|uniref:DUF6703 family protein n=1 Tax=Spongiactinospora gelatinilytica TaxID=2666298 RepID=UPI001F36C905|nr:DUF6703 family protein [Spongiactinospora gelatinilytica]
MAEQRDPNSEGRRVPSHPLARRAGEPGAGKGGPPRGGKSRRPLPQGEQFFTPGATGFRKAVEERSAAPLVFLFGLPRWVVPVLMVALLLVGFAVPDWRGGVAVLPVAGFVGWLAYMSWPSLRVGGRLMRVALLTFLALLAADRFGLF